MFGKLKKASGNELLVWMLSAFVFGIGLGAIFAGNIKNYALAIAAASLVVHLWSMYRIYGRK